MTKKLFIVDTITTSRLRYVIEATDIEHAYDEVSMVNSGNDDDSFPEVSQRWLGETIIDGREITQEDYKTLLSEYEQDKLETCSYWMGEKLIRKIDYSK